jgi:Ca2+/H+ antiporter
VYTTQQPNQKTNNIKTLVITITKITYIIFLRQHTTQLKHTNTNQERENKEQYRETKQNKTQNPKRE